jgi:iron complex transport system ATP-binding protein
MLDVEKIAFLKQGASILNGISFSLKAGEILGVIGPNGAGKTSLVKALLGDISVAGSVALNGRNLKKITNMELAKQVAVLPQHSLLNFPYTVDEVVMLGRTPHSTGIKIDAAIVEEAMAAMDISYLAARRYTELSGGEKQRTQLARVMAQVWRAEDADCRLLILDEPTSALDLGHQQQLMEQVKRFASQGVAVLLVEHDLNVIANYADTVLALQCGRIKSYGTVPLCLSEELVSQLFNARVSVIKQDGRVTIVNRPPL